ncbi:hypothetical protein M3Y98_00654200 [Aphelenchoides besseyi]|nr:hypothetical protein M3Y98_00654200 [Aphelenchoides besseyi]KAI6208707.1 hypothetical protein M3Y96_00143500 [Aphelenchoides besseyi]
MTGRNRTVSWQLTNFSSKFDDSIFKDSWQSDIYALEHPEFGQVRFYFQFFPKGGANAENEDSSLFVCLHRHSNLKLKMECEASVERIDGHKSDTKKEEITLDEQNGEGGWNIFLSRDELKAFSEYSNVFICCRMPYKVKKVGVASESQTIFRWELTNFSERIQDASYKTEWRSNEFGVDGCGAATFAVSLYPKGYRDYHKEHVGLFFRCKRLNGNPSVSISFEMWMENSEGLRTHKEIASYTYNEKDGRGCSNYLEQSKFLEFCSKEPVFICCNARVIVSSMAELYATAFHRSIAQTFNCAEYSDFDVKVDGQVFKTSKLVLRTQSPAIAKRIAASAQNEMEIHGVKASVVEVLLRFLYSGEVKKIDEIAFDLLPLADEFELDEISDRCVEAIAKNIKIENAIESLKLAATDSRFEPFKTQMLAFADEKFNAIKTQPEWEEFGCSHPKIVLELLALSHMETSN